VTLGVQLFTLNTGTLLERGSTTEIISKHLLKPCVLM